MLGSVDVQAIERLARLRDVFAGDRTRLVYPPCSHSADEIMRKVF